MTTKEYLEIYDRCPDEYNPYEGSEKDLESIRSFNKELIRKYPWLEPRNNWSGKRISVCAGPDGEEGFWPGDPKLHPKYNYEYTILDDMPEGWRIAFGDEMMERIQKELERFDYSDKYFVSQIKEKFGGLRWYDEGIPIKLSEDYKEIFTFLYKDNGEPKVPKPANDNEVVKEISRTHYISPFDKEKRNGMTDEEVDKYNQECVVKYHIHTISDECHVPDIIKEYEDKSYVTCIRCGKPAKWESKGWICPYCDDCKNALISNKETHMTEDSFMKITDFNEVQE